MKKIITQTSRKDSDPFADTPQSSSRFKQYLEEKVQKIQQTKLKTMKMTEKYFSQIKEKIDKYLAKQQKKILNAYEDNINMSINCVNHHFLYDFETMCIKNGNSQRKQSKQFLIAGNQQQPRKKSYESQNQLTIKIQVKRLIDEMLLAETHLNQTVKIIGQEIKSDLQKIIFPLGDLFSKIPKLTQISQTSSTLLVKDFSATNQKKKQKNGNKTKKMDFQNIKNPEILVQKLLKQSVKNQNEQSLSQTMTDKLLKKSKVLRQNLNGFIMDEGNRLLKLKQISEKEDKIATSINKNVKHKNLIIFDLINGKSLFHVYQKQVCLDIMHNAQQNPQRVEQLQLNYQMILNDKPLLEDQNQFGFKFESYCKIQFEYKPDREYLALLSSKSSTVNQGGNVRKFKNYKITIFNYKGDMITKDLVSNLKVSDTQNPVKVFQLPSIRQYIFIVLNNRIKRYSLKNLLDHKSKLFSLQDKIIKAQANDDKIILFEGRKKIFQLLNSDLVLLQTFQWESLYPNTFSMNDFINIRVNMNEDDKVIEHHGEMSMIIPKATIDTIYYFQHNTIKRLELKLMRETWPEKESGVRFESISSINEIHQGVYLLSSRRKEWGKQYLDLFIMQIELIGKKLQDQQQASLMGVVSYLETVRQEIREAKFIKNHFYITLKTGKVLAYDLV